MRKVVITGMGVVSPLGCDLPRFWQRLTEGRSGIRRVTKIDITPYASQIAGEVVEFNLDAFLSKKNQRRTDPYSHYSIAAAKLALADSGVDMAKEIPAGPA